MVGLLHFCMSLWCTSCKVLKRKRLFFYLPIALGQSISGFAYCLPGANHRLVAANYRLAAANYRLVGANNSQRGI